MGRGVGRGGPPTGVVVGVVGVHHLLPVCQQLRPPGVLAARAALLGAPRACGAAAAAGQKSMRCNGLAIQAQRRGAHPSGGARSGGAMAKQMAAHDKSGAAARAWRAPCGGTTGCSPAPAPGHTSAATPSPTLLWAPKMATNHRPQLAAAFAPLPLRLRWWSCSSSRLVFTPSLCGFLPSCGLLTASSPASEAEVGAGEAARVGRAEKRTGLHAPFRAVQPQLHLCERAASQATLRARASMLAVRFNHSPA